MSENKGELIWNDLRTAPGNEKVRLHAVRIVSAGEVTDNEGLYSINAIVLTDGTNADVYEREVISFTVHESGAMRKEYGGGWLGVVRPRLAWQT